MSESQAPADADAPESGFNEDWLATILGLALVVVILLGVLPKGLVP